MESGTKAKKKKQNSIAVPKTKNRVFRYITVKILKSETYSDLNVSTGKKKKIFF